ncbi:MAG: four helix bundle protein [Bacteroidetes bacterium]|nr:MAG: four helix bundle protein [Bacteroidota bacterium]
MGMHKFRELLIWQRSMDLVVDIYKATLTFPKEEKFGLISQLRSCAISIPSNISEGAGRSSDSQFKHFLQIAMGSCSEVQTQVELATRLEYLRKEVMAGIVDEATQIYKMILSFYYSLDPNK